MADDKMGVGRAIDGVRFPAAPSASRFNGAYSSMRESILSEIGRSRLQFIVQANAAMIAMYWNIGNEIIRRQSENDWGASVIDRLSKDITESFPEAKGFSPRNLSYMKRFAQCWTDPEILQQVVAKLPWRSNILLMRKLGDAQSRLWYANKALENGWSSAVLDVMISARLIEREGKEVNNFAAALPPPDSDMAVQAFKDPYLFDFLGADAPRREAELESRLIDHIEKFLLELGQGFAFIGRQVHLEMGDADYYVDLLFYHTKLRCYVVIELKVSDFQPEFVGQLNMYQNIVNDVLRHPDDNPTIGLLLVKGKNKTIVEYSLTGVVNPIGVADWQTRLTNELPEELSSSLPTIEEIERELNEGG
jgi:predicted nuclease of restriction endonuclease-like (RecB) superfamily